MSWLYRLRIHLILFFVGLFVFGIVAHMRTDAKGESKLWKTSTDPHFIWQAQAWLEGNLAVDKPAQGMDDPAIVLTVEEVGPNGNPGRTLRGRYLKSRKIFKTTSGEEIPNSRIKRRIEKTYYVSFPPFPAVLMIPQVALSGQHANDVLTTVLLAALILPLFFTILRRIREEELSSRDVSDDIWLTISFAFGTVLFFCAVQGRVWFTAHVIGVLLALCYVRSAIGAKHPLLAGLFLGLATMTRVPMAFMFPFFALEAWRVYRGVFTLTTIFGTDAKAQLRALLKSYALFALPVVIVAICAMLYNHARFDSFLEFGHSYLDVRQQFNIETKGMFSLDYLSRNLSVAFTLLPDLSTTLPSIKISGHGMAMWLTSPILFLLLWPKTRGSFHTSLWITVACVAIPTFLYQNTGWVQFGYRFALDYMPFLYLLISVGNRKFTPVVKGLMIFAIIFNLFGAITFGDGKYYKRSSHDYKSVIAN